MAFVQRLTGSCFIGIDVGGTKVRAIGLNSCGVAIADLTEPTQKDILSQLSRIVDELGRGVVAGVGIGVPGAVNPTTGVVTKVPNVPSLEGIALRDVLSLRFGVPVVVENDVITAALAEQRMGQHEAEMIAVIAAGTGIGLGIVYRGELVRGAHGAAGEIAELPMERGGVLEDRVSIAGLMANYRAAGGQQQLSPLKLLQQAQDGVPAAKIATDRYTYWLAHGIRTVIATIDPGRVVLTGGLGSAPAVHTALHNHLDHLAGLVTVSVLGADSPAHGATLLAQHIGEFQ